MDIASTIHDIAERILKQVPHVQSEEATKLAMVNPFLREVLGYDTSDLTQVQPEFVADVGIKQGEKVDYALIHDGEPVILIEAKVTGTPLDKAEPSQLFRYYAALDSARFGIFTDGVKYLFFTDIDKANVMDTRPFLTLDLSDIKQEAVEEVARFVRTQFNPSEIREKADALKYVQGLREKIAQEFRDPSDDFVRLLMSSVYDGLKTQHAVDAFRIHTQKALKSFVEVNLRERLAAAFGKEAGETEIPEPEKPEVEITNEEVKAFFIIKALLHDVIDVDRLHLVERKDHCVVLVDGSVRKLVCKLWLRDRPHHIELVGYDEEGNRFRTFPRLQSIDDIYVHEPVLESKEHQILKSFG